MSQTQSFQTKNNRGQGLVEFALIAMLLILIAFGIMDFARVFHATIVITNASREGARHYASSPNVTLLQTRQAAEAEALGAGIVIPLDNIQAEIVDSSLAAECAGGTCAGDWIAVTVNYEFATFLGSLFSVSPFNISRTTQMLLPGLE